METLNGFITLAANHPVELLAIVVLLALLVTFASARWGRVPEPAYLPLRSKPEPTSYELKDPTWRQNRPLHRGGYEAQRGNPQGHQRNFGNPRAGVGVSWSEPPAGRIAEHVYRSGDPIPGESGMKNTLA